jgi:uncharacterized protein YbcI
MSDQPATPEEESRYVVEHDWLRGVQTDGQGNMLASLSNAMVGLKKEYYGKGPVKARTYINDQYVFCVMEGGLTRNERTLVERGHESTVRDYRLTFQEAIGDTITQAVERITGRKVIGYHSQITFDPDTIFEIFVLDRPPDDGYHG